MIFKLPPHYAGQCMINIPAASLGPRYHVVILTQKTLETVRSAGRH